MPRLSQRRLLASREFGPRRNVRQKLLQRGLEAVHGCSRGAVARQKHLGQARNEALDAEDVEDACEVVAKRHQAPFSANLVEAAKQEVAVSCAALDRAEGMLGDGEPAAHQLVCALHPGTMSLQNILMLPASDGADGRLLAETTRL